jgi:hypothetical protein
MNLVYNVSQVMHSIKVKLYPNYLPKGEGTFIVRTNSEATLSIEEVCAALRDRGGFTGDFEDLVNHVKEFHNEAAYQLCDGFTVNTGYYSIYPNVGGLFKTPHEKPNPKEHPLTFRFRPNLPMKKLAESISVDVDGVAPVGGWIDEFTDTEEHSVNHVFVPGNMFVITGHKIKIEGDDPGCGLYFVPVDDPSGAVKATRISENTPSRITGISPATEHSKIRLEIRTQYSDSSTLLKKPRVIASDFILEEA